MIGIAVLVALAILCVVLIGAVVVKTRDDAAAAAREAAEYTPPPLTSAAPAASGRAVVVIGDETALRAGSGVSESERWPQLLGSATDDSVITIASPGAGYATAGADRRTFVEAVSDVPSDARTVLFVGGGADDQVSALSLARAATQAFSAASEQAPEASVIAVGPVFRTAETSQTDLSTLRSTLRSAARIADVPWVDPIAAKWVTGTDETADLSAAKERAIASRLAAAIESETD